MFYMDVIKFTQGPTCDNMKQQHGFCLGGNACNVHRTPTDHLAMLLEKQKWASPKMQDVMSDPDMVGYLIMASAGSLLRPVICNQCQ